MVTLQQAAQQALEALEHVEAVYRLNVVKDGEPSSTLENLQVNITALRQALEAAQQTPDLLLLAIQHLNFNPYSLTKNECIDLLKELRETHSGAITEQQELVADAGWLQSGGLLYRLTDERRPQNRDEINVTMADESRSIDARTRRAKELLNRIRSTHPQPAQQPLTDKQVLDMAEGCTAQYHDLLEFARAIECAHGIK